MKKSSALTEDLNIKNYYLFGNSVLIVLFTVQFIHFELIMVVVITIIIVMIMMHMTLAIFNRTA